MTGDVNLPPQDASLKGLGRFAKARKTALAAKKELSQIPENDPRSPAVKLEPSKGTREVSRAVGSKPAEDEENIPPLQPTHQILAESPSVARRIPPIPHTTPATPLKTPAQTKSQNPLNVSYEAIKAGLKEKLAMLRDSIENRAPETKKASEVEDALSEIADIQEQQVLEGLEKLLKDGENKLKEQLVKKNPDNLLFDETEARYLELLYTIQHVLIDFKRDPADIHSELSSSTEAIEDANSPQAQLLQNLLRIRSLLYEQLDVLNTIEKSPTGKVTLNAKQQESVIKAKELLEEGKQNLLAALKSRDKTSPFLTQVELSYNTLLNDVNLAVTYIEILQKDMTPPLPGTK